MRSKEKLRIAMDVILAVLGNDRESMGGLDPDQAGREVARPVQHHGTQQPLRRPNVFHCSLCGNLILMQVPEGTVIPLIFCSPRCLEDYGANKTAWCETGKRRTK